MVHAGFAIAKVSEQEAQETIDAFEMLDEAIARAQQAGVDQAIIAAAKSYRARCLSEPVDADRCLSVPR